MSLTFDDIVNNPRMERLFSSSTLPCVMQFWFLELRINNERQYRFLYGRLLPYHHINNSFFINNSKTIQSTQGITAKLFSIIYFIDSSKAEYICRDLFDGINLDLINKQYQLQKLNKRKAFDFLTDLKIDTNALVFSNVYFCLNKYCYDRDAVSGPCGEEGCFCASVWPKDRSLLFDQLDSCSFYNLIKELSKETGISFKSENSNIVRLGSFEFLTFPSLNDFEEILLDTAWNKEGVVLSYISNKKIFEGEYYFVLTLVNDGKLFDSFIKKAKKEQDGKFVCRFLLSQNQIDLTDGCDIKLYYKTLKNKIAKLVCHKQIPYIKEINLVMNAMTGSSTIMLSDWIDKKVPNFLKDRAKSVQTISRNVTYSNLIDIRDTDDWSVLNRNFKKFINQTFPIPSEGKFFPRISECKTSRLDFVNWFKTICAQHKNCVVYLFDPYFDVSGFYLLEISAQSDSEYHIFTCLNPNESDTKENRINKIKTCFLKTKNLIPHNLHITIDVLPSHSLHDRYLLFQSINKETFGFHLSNSLDKQSENYPFLITPIPNDVLLSLCQYIDHLLESKRSTQQFNTDAERIDTGENLSVFDKKGVGNLLSEIFHIPELSLLSGQSLKVKLVNLGLCDQEFQFTNTELILSYVHQFVVKKELASKWLVYAEILSQIPKATDWLLKQKLGPDSIAFLTQFINKKLKEDSNGWLPEERVSGGLYNSSLDDMYRSCKAFPIMTKVTKPKLIGWAEYYSIRLIWTDSPGRLLDLFDNQTPPNSLKTHQLFECVSNLAFQSMVSHPFDFNLARLLVSSQRSWLKVIGYSGIVWFSQRFFGRFQLDNFFQSLSIKNGIDCLIWCSLYFRYPLSQCNKFEYFASRLIDKIPDYGRSEYYLDYLLKVQSAWWIFGDLLIPAVAVGKLDKSLVTDLMLNKWLVELKEDSESSLYKSDIKVLQNLIELFISSDQNKQVLWLGELEKIVKAKERVISRPLSRHCSYDEWSNSMNTIMKVGIFVRLVILRLNFLKKEVPLTFLGLEKRIDFLVSLRANSEWSLNQFDEELLSLVIDEN